MTIRPSDIEGVILSGGQGRRMGGVDEGMQSFRGQPLALHALATLRRQVGLVKVSAARNLDAYRAWGHPVVVDEDATSEGPLAGVLAAVRLCRAPFLATAPCDVPMFPDDIVRRLAVEMEEAGAMAAMPLVAQEDGAPPRVDPSFLLIRHEALPSLEAYFASGGRKMMAWTNSAGAAIAPFTDRGDEVKFLDADTFDALARLEALAGPIEADGFRQGHSSL